MTIFQQDAVTHQNTAERENRCSLYRHISFRLVLAALLTLQGWIAAAQQNPPVSFYSNPVIPGDVPDPTIIRVGDKYYAAGTTSDFAPHYPVYESTDLINWEQIGSIFNDRPEWTSDSFWAPEFYYRDGTFYVYYTAKRKGDRISCIGVASTRNIREGFTDHGIIVEWGNEAIDAYIFQDDDGKTYIFWKAYGLDPSRPIEILGAELSADLLSISGEHFTLTDHSKGWKGSGDEGQVILKRNGMYYMLYSIGGCCDNRCDYRVMVSRSKNLKEGWEQLSGPILQGGGEWVCPGHGSLVTTPDGRYFYLYHSYNRIDFEYTGRQGLLDELVWNEATGWPYFKNGNTPSVSAPVPFPGTKQARTTIYADQFRNDKNRKFWQWDINKAKPLISMKGGKIRISSEETGRVFTGISPKSGNYTFEATIRKKDQLEKGICVYGNRRNMLYLTLQENRLTLVSVKNGNEEIVASREVPAKYPVTLKLEATDGRYYQFFYTEKGSVQMPLEWQGTSSFDGNFLPQWGVAMRTGLIFNNQGISTAEFSSVRMETKFKDK